MDRENSCRVSLNHRRFVRLIITHG
jgi:hypothetical protein